MREPPAKVAAAEIERNAWGLSMRLIRGLSETKGEGGTMAMRQAMAAAAACGLASGIALGAVVGPAGVVLGVAIGVGIGVVAGYVLAREEAKRERRTRELDAIIGITNGSMGAGPVKLTVIEPEASEMYSSREAWAAEWLTPPPPAVR